MSQVDHDKDGKPDITNVPKEGGGYAFPLTSLLQTQHADRLYVASRPMLTLQATVDGCPDMYTGTAMVTNFDMFLGEALLRLCEPAKRGHSKPDLERELEAPLQRPAAVDRDRSMTNAAKHFDLIFGVDRSGLRRPRKTNPPSPSFCPRARSCRSRRVRR